MLRLAPLVEQLDLELEDYLALDRERFAGVLLVDTQPEFAHTVVPDDLPIAAVFDHHVPPGGACSPSSSATRPRVGWYQQNLRRLVLGCIEAKFCK